MPLDPKMTAEDKMAVVVLDNALSFVVRVSFMKNEQLVWLRDSLKDSAEEARHNRCYDEEKLFTQMAEHVTNKIQDNYLEKWKRQTDERERNAAFDSIAQALNSTVK